MMMGLCGSVSGGPLWVELVFRAGHFSRCNYSGLSLNGDEDEMILFSGTGNENVGESLASGCS